MRIWVGSEAHELTDSDVLGIGGEATVYKLPQQRALKVYHPLGPKADPLARRLLEEKKRKLESFPRDLPPEVVGPEELARDARKKTVGFAMRRVDGAVELMRLSERAHREGRLSNAEVCALFLRLHRLLSALHQRGLVVGDLNDGNVLCAGEQPWLIDADSLQLPGYPCLVAHERFLDPRLYGVDLAARPALSPDSDWYAFAVLLFSALLYVHPYGGTHPRHPTLLRRAEARCSVLRPEVRRPKVAAEPQALPPALEQHFAQVFDQDLRGVFPQALLEARWARCPCGLEHGRISCPACAQRGHLSPRPGVRIHGRCRAIPILRTRGRILTAVLQDRLRWLVEEEGVLRREDGTKVLEGRVDPLLRFALQGPRTWVGLGESLVAIEAGQVVDRASTGGRESFDAGAELLRTEGEWLLEGRPGARFGRVLEGQTWVRTGRALGFCFYRARGASFYFVLRPGRPGLTEVRLPPLAGRLIEAQASFDQQHLLFGTVCERSGRRETRLALVEQSGRVLATLAGAPDSHPALGGAGGKCVLGSRVLAATDDGLVLLEADPGSGALVLERSFPDTEAFVGARDHLILGPGGSVYVVRPQEIIQLVLE